MTTKNFPFPDGLTEREIVRPDQESERLRRMTAKEEESWKTEALQKSMAELIDSRVRPSYKLLSAKIDAKVKECDELFESLLKP